MGFNPMQPGKIRPADLAMFAFGLAMIAAVLIWAFH
jgi:hypothetical protein